MYISCLHCYFRCVPRQPGPGLSLESYVYNLLYNVPIPLPGKTLKFFVPNEEPAKPSLDFVIYHPPSTELPLLEYPIKELFAWLDLHCILQLFTCVMLENQVLIKSTDFHKLMVVSECITSLLYPFAWQHVYVPILPASLDHFLDAPVPFIMGLYAQNESGILKIASEVEKFFISFRVCLFVLRRFMVLWPISQKTNGVKISSRFREVLSRKLRKS